MSLRPRTAAMTPEEIAMRYPFMPQGWYPTPEQMEPLSRGIFPPVGQRHGTTGGLLPFQGDPVGQPEPDYYQAGIRDRQQAAQYYAGISGRPQPSMETGAPTFANPSVRWATPAPATNVPSSGRSAYQRSVDAFVTGPDGDIFEHDPLDARQVRIEPNGKPTVALKYGPNLFTLRSRANAGDQEAKQQVSQLDAEYRAKRARYDTLAAAGSSTVFNPFSAAPSFFRIGERDPNARKPGKGQGVIRRGNQVFAYDGGAQLLDQSANPRAFSSEEEALNALAGPQPQPGARPVAAAPTPAPAPVPAVTPQPTPAPAAAAPVRPSSPVQPVAKPAPVAPSQSGPLPTPAEVSAARGSSLPGSLNVFLAGKTLTDPPPLDAPFAPGYSAGTIDTRLDAPFAPGYSAGTINTQPTIASNAAVDEAERKRYAQRTRTPTVADDIRNTNQAIGDEIAQSFASRFNPFEGSTPQVVRRSTSNVFQPRQRPETIEEPISPGFSGFTSDLILGPRGGSPFDRFRAMSASSSALADPRGPLGDRDMPFAVGFPNSSIGTGQRNLQTQTGNPDVLRRGQPTDVLDDFRTANRAIGNDIASNLGSRFDPFAVRSPQVVRRSRPTPLSE